MLGLVGAQLKHKVENKQVKAGKAIWVDVSQSGVAVIDWILTMFRSVVVRGMFLTSLGFN